jgi:hypothetical protein
METAVLVALALVAAVVAVYSLTRANAAESARRALWDKTQELEKRVATVQEELNSAREEGKRKALALDESREKLNKARRRDEPKAEKDKPGPDPAAVAKYANAAEAAEKRAKAAEQKAQQMAEAAKAQVQREMQGQVDELKRKLAAKEQEAAPKEATEAAPVEPKREGPKGPRVPPELKGERVALDVKTLPQPVIDELARFMRRAHNAEKLTLVADGQREVLTDKMEELQRRYFAVCRELALAAVNKDKPRDISDDEAAKLANDMVAASEEAGRRRAQQRGKVRPPRDGHEARHEPPGKPAVAGPAVVPASPPGEKQPVGDESHEGRRRRRNRHGAARPDGTEAVAHPEHGRPQGKPQERRDSSKPEPKPVEAKVEESKPEAPKPVEAKVEESKPEPKPVEAKVEESKPEAPKPDPVKAETPPAEGSPPA